MSRFNETSLPARYPRSSTGSCTTILSTLTVARLVLDRRTGAGTVLNHQSMSNCGPGGNANNGANELFVTGNTFTGGTVFDLRMEVSDTSFPADADILTFGYAGQVGDFEVEPPNAIAEVNQSYIYPVI